MSPGFGGPRRVFFTCWLIYTVFWTPYIIREHFPAITLAEYGTLDVASYRGWTEDIFPGPAGRVLINNNPGASLTGAIPLILLRPVLARLDAWNRSQPRIPVPPNDGDLFWRTLGEGRALYFLAVAFLTVALVMAPATAGTAAYLCARIFEAGVAPASAAAAGLLYGIGTPVLFRTGHLNHNLLAGNAGFFALLLVWDPRRRPLTAIRAVGAGLLAGYSVLCDYSGLVILGVTAWYVWLRSADAGDRSRRLMTAFAAGVVPFALAAALYQLWAFGSPFLPAQHYMPPTAPTVMGYRGFDWPSPTLAWANFFDPRYGLFAYCPALLLGLAAPFSRGMRHHLPVRETWILFTYFLLFVVFCAANRYSWLQHLTGFRYLVPIVPALAVLTFAAAQVLPSGVRWGLGAVACLQSLVLTGVHENDLREVVGVLASRRGELFWMIRLRQADSPWNVPALLLWLLLFLTLTLIWAPWLRRTAALKAAPGEA
jgi:hypothetical protein